jgi:hypothetical protein
VDGLPRWLLRGARKFGPDFNLAGARGVSANKNALVEVCARRADGQNFGHSRYQLAELKSSTRTAHVHR